MSNFITQKITVSFTTDGLTPVVKAMQYDNNMRVVEAAMTANGVPFLVPDGYSVNIRMRKPDGTCVYNPALEVSGNTAKIVLTQQMLAFSGKAAAILEVVGGENGVDVLGTAHWCIDIASNPVPEEFVESTNEFRTIQQLEAACAAAAAAAAQSEINAGKSASTASTKANEAAASAQNAAISASSAAGSASSAVSSASTANTKANEASASAADAASSASTAAASAGEAKAAEESAKAAVASFGFTVADGMLCVAYKQ